jgi:branched-chain amino acid transport system substrate-binding protein
VDYRPVLARVRVKRPALMILIANPSDGALIMRQSRQLNLTPSLVLGESAGFAQPAFAEAGGGFGEFVCALVPWAPSASNPGARRFTENYRLRFGKVPGYHAAMAYAALTVLADSARRGRSETRRALREALADTDLTTLCGRIRFDPRSARPGQNRSSWLLVQWQAGRLETVWPPAKASADPVFPAPAWRSRNR